MKLNKVVIVLGKRLVGNQLTAEGRTRVEALVDALGRLCFSSTAIVFCGGVTQGNVLSEADAMHAYFLQLSSARGVVFPPQQIIVENRSLNTVENMQNAAFELHKSGLCKMGQSIKVLLLSSQYHLERIIEIQTLMDEQGLLRVLKMHCAQKNIELDIPLVMHEHISVPYPHSGKLAEAFLLCDELTTYRVYLEGVRRGVFKRELSKVKSKPLAIALSAIERLETLKLDDGIQRQISEMKKAVEVTAFDDSVLLAEEALSVFHPILTALNQQLDPEAATEC
ncbi:YdcF family protein [Vibrio alfacsensis]|uniref:YdcF family protein n=1 Tax=Vibrio alfacsensis TaxID=1074311 RepID=UPI001BEDF88C|nr:YdcF family protein [Vibrio alfacsensis]BCN25684.1 hypothetical protein VYA_28760 [Vibrio alfacsensis]